MVGLKKKKNSRHSLEQHADRPFVGYAYFAPTIIRSYGYGREWTTDGLNGQSSLIVISQRSRRSYIPSRHGQLLLDFPC